MKRMSVMVSAGVAVLMLAAGVSAELYNRAPSVLPGTNPEWRNPSYWVSRMTNPDAVIMTPERIQKMNEAYEAAIRRPDPFAGLSKERTPNLDHWWPGYATYPPDLFAMTPREAAGIVRAQIKIQIDYLRSKPYGNVNAIEYDAADIDRFEREMALDSVPNEITPRRGLAVVTALVRNIPTANPQEIGLPDNSERRYDMFNVCLVKIATPLTVLYPSRSGRKLLVMTGDAYGWVDATAVAFGDESVIRRFSDPKSFVVCTGDQVMLYGDESCTVACGAFGMGDRLPLAVDNDTRHVEVPVRMSDGQLIYETAWLRANDPVHVGWLPYTRRNVVETAFRLMDNPYDWTGSYFGRNHETTYRDIFACFGFRLPWHGALFTMYAGTDDVAVPDRANQNKGQFATILKHEPFMTLISAGGHTQLLLGEENGVPVVFDNHGYEYTDENKTAWKVRRTCVGQMNNPGLTSYMLTRPLTIAELK